MRIYRFRDLKAAGWPFTRKHTTTLEKQGKFPMHFNIGENTVAWDAEAVDAEIQRRIRAGRVIPLAAARDEHRPDAA